MEEYYKTVGHKSTRALYTSVHVGLDELENKGVIDRLINDINDNFYSSYWMILHFMETFGVDASPDQVYSYIDNGVI